MKETYLYLLKHYIGIIEFQNEYTRKPIYSVLGELG